MKRFIGVALLCAMIVSLISGCSPATVETTESTEVSESAPVRPQDDYYWYVNETSLSNAVFEYGEHYVGDAADTSLVDSQLDTVIDEVIAGSGYETGSEEVVILHINLFWITIFLLSLSLRNWQLLLMKSITLRLLMNCWCSMLRLTGISR